MPEKLKDLPIGESDIKSILTNNFIYVDKTKHIYEMVRVPGKFFLSRPRRFGKSTLLSTLYEVFKGNKELFKDQWIYNSDWDWQEYPVIRMDFNAEISADLSEYIKQTLMNIAIVYGVFDEDQYNRSSYGMYFRIVVAELYKKYNQQVVILIDECDKPMLDVIDNIEEAKAKREILKGFYTVIKGLDEYIRFVFLTGVTKFSKVGIFSGLNNLRDISMSDEYSDICGINQEELELYCKNYIELISEKEQLSYNECLAKIKHWYDGFCFSKDGISVYNPYSTLLLFQEKRFSNYWFSSGNPSFLIKLLMKNKYYLPNLHNTSVDPIYFDSFDIDAIELTVLLLQAGYLTISKTNVSDLVQDVNYQNEIPLAIPNYEIGMSLNAYILQYVYGNGLIPSKLKGKFTNSILSDDMELLKAVITSIFASIPYNWYTNNDMQHYEGFYCSLFYAFLTGMGYNVIAEDVTNYGRIDITVILANKVYIFELKTTDRFRESIYSMDNGNGALEQIKMKNYAQKYQNGKYEKIYCIGMEFSETKRNLTSFSYECI